MPKSSAKTAARPPAKAARPRSKPEPAAEWVALSRLKLWPANPRDNDGEPVERVMKSIKRFGFGAPIVARRADGEIIAGHARFKAAQALELGRVPRALSRHLETRSAPARARRQSHHATRTAR